MPRSLLLRWLMRAAQIDRAHLNVTNDKTLGFNIKTNANFLPRSSVTVTLVSVRVAHLCSFFVPAANINYPAARGVNLVLTKKRFVTREPFPGSAERVVFYLRVCMRVCVDPSHRVYSFIQ